MPEICETCGLPEPLCICDEEDAHSNETVDVHTEERSYGKTVTIVSGLNNPDEVDELSSELKSQFACGGTVNDGGNELAIELQGDHQKRLIDEMRNRGYKVEAQ